MSLCSKFSKRLAGTLAVTIAGGLFAAPAWAFTVTAATASVNPQSYSGRCPTTFTFTGKITADGPGTVTYNWGHVPYVFGNRTVTFTGPGTQIVSYQLAMDGEWPASEGHWLDLLIQSPNFVNGGHVTFQLKCSNQQRGPRPVPVTLKDGSAALIIGDRLWLVLPGRQVPAPDGTYELNDGTKIVVRGYKIVRKPPLGRRP
jgi:hypothetical protein